MAWSDLGSFGTGLAQLGIGLAQLLTMLPPRRQRPEGGPGLRPERTSAYLDFQAAATSVYDHLGVIGNLGPPKLVGAFWTWPQLLRSQRTLVESANAMAVAFGRIAMFGSDECQDTARNLAYALAEAMQRYPRGDWLGRVSADARRAYGEKLTAAGRSLHPYLAAVASELT